MHYTAISFYIASSLGTRVAKLPYISFFFIIFTIYALYISSIFPYNKTVILALTAKLSIATCISVAESFEKKKD